VSIKIPMTPSGIEHVTFRLVTIIAINFNASASKLSVFRNLFLYNYSFVFNSDIDVKLFFEL
jgi:hypothetical protein